MLTRLTRAMLIPLNRKKFEELIPRIATGDQYKYCWGKLPDILRRLLFSLAGVIVLLLVRFILGDTFNGVLFVLCFAPGFYWLWEPVYQASRQNIECRRYPYAGFWQGEVLDAFVTEELVGTEETVNNRGELVVVENRERRLNLEVGDENEFVTKLQVPLRRDHRMIRPGDIAQMVVMSYRPDLSRISKVSDIYLSDYNLWVSDYPYLRRDTFVEVSRQLSQRPRKRR